KYFVAAEVFNYKDLHELGSEAEVRKKGKCYTKGKMYVVEDGDIIHFKFNAPKGGGGSKKGVWCVNDTNY
ncbi:DUF933 domain-containing protein, partial [Hamiltosporidium magnivora]